MEGKLQIILKDVFMLLHEKFNEYVFNQDFDINLENSNTYFTSFHLIIDLIEILIVSSKEFATTFHMVKFLFFLIYLITNNKFCKFF